MNCVEWWGANWAQRYAEMSKGGEASSLAREKIPPASTSHAYKSKAEEDLALQIEQY